MKTITINGKEYVVRPTALTPMLFKRMTNRDLLSVITDKSTKDMEKLESIIKLFYIMQMQATCHDVKVEFEKAEDEMAYFEFLDSIDSKALYSEEVIKQIISVYMVSTKTTSDAKN